MFDLTLGDYKFNLGSAQELAAFLNEMWGEDVNDTLKMARELKRDQPHVVMGDDNGTSGFYTVEKVK